MEPVLEYLDLNDNFIGEFDQMKYLQSYVHLTELIFQGSNNNNGSNPMCDFENYEEAVRLYLP